MQYFKSGLQYLILILACGFIPFAQAAAVDDIRIVIDVSGSMLKTDPNNLRVPAARMLNGILPSGSYAGVWTFGRYANMEVKWGRVDDRWRKLADQGASKIHSRGQFTNIDGALKRASTGWTKPDPKTRRNIILLTDGQVDISKNSDKNAQSRQNLINKTIPNLVKNGIQVHAIALSNQSDEELLKQLAHRTSGSFEVAETASQLQRIFLKMFERAARPNTVSLKGKKFTIDNSIREMTLLIFRKNNTATSLFQPDNKKHSENKHGSNVNWRNDEGYDLITIKKPMAGEWTLEANIDPDNRVMIVTDLKLKVNKLPAYTTPDQLLDLQVELHSKNKKISKNSFLKFVDFKLLHQIDGESKSLKLELKKSREVKDKGIYLQTIKAPLQEGTHELIISADARTFSRSKRVSVDVQWPVEVVIDKTPVAGEYTITVKPRKAIIKPDSLRPEVLLLFPDGKQQVVKLQQTEDSEWNGEIRANEHNGLHKLEIEVKAELHNGGMVQHKLDGYSLLGVVPEPEPVAEAEAITENEQIVEAAEIQSEQSEEDDSGMMNSIILLSAINGVLLLIGGGVYFFMRKKKIASDDLGLMDEVEEDTEEKEDD